MLCIELLFLISIVMVVVMSRSTPGIVPLHHENYKALCYVPSPALLNFPTCIKL